MRRYRGRVVARVLAVACLQSVAATAGDYPVYDDDGLQQGRTVWLENCEGCHGYGIGGAPVPSRAEDWRERLGKPVSTLYEHAINGFYGPDDTIMPARGGNEQLDDGQVRRAVDYMRRLALEHQEPGEE